MSSRVYICHTFYHLYVTVMKELNIKSTVCYENEVLGTDDCNRGKADLLLSTMSNNFGNIKERLVQSGLFANVYMFDEKEDITSDEVMAYHKDKGNIVSNMIQRIKYTKLLGKLQESEIPVDLKGYDDVYVFCDSDPIGYYLNYKKIPYHALEDGLNSGLLDDQARNANRGAWGLKRFLAKLGLIFIESGYSRYCIDYEVNDISVNKKPPKNIKEVSFESMWKPLTDEDHKVIVDIFLGNADRLLAQLDVSNYQKRCVMILTEPLCELDVREQLFGDIVREYEQDYMVIIKPHPRDLLDYEAAFPNAVVIKDRFPMEVMNDIPGLEVEKLISVITQVNCVYFAKEIEYLGMDFLDKYEDPAIHRKTEMLNL